MDIPPAKEYLSKDFFSDGSLALHVLHMDLSIEYPLHHHDFYELVLVYNGSGLHICGEKSSNVISGDILFIPVLQEHAYQNVKELSYVNIIFSKSLLPNTFIDPTVFLHLHLTEFDLKILLNIVNQLDREIYRKEIEYAEFSKSLLIQLLIKVKRTIHKSSYLVDTNIELRVQNVIEFICSNLSSHYTLRELSEMANTSSRNFSRVFKRLYGLSVFQYINMERIKESIILIRETTMTITQISSLVGFDEPSYFSLLFKKIMKCSPSNYRHL
nr:helix-turn-helix domain-containing protein [Marispirochaeta sp.]